ncbi:MAG: UDP-N-acetylmuramoyl-L-alanine--D-glutamate ligase [Oscillospiraceae bacterium]|nr:UDP-N-acetylmuramoyl-L-alanine--D-glutamate ligase [Oscillospiraceae bacterium]
MEFNAYFQSLKGKNIAVLGLGVSNRPLVKLLLSFGCAVIGCDRTPREKLDKEVLQLEEMGCRLSLGETYLDSVSADLVFRTPGMHPSNPGILRLRQGGAEITSEMEVFFELCPCPIIAVTGSDGKTTTTTLIAEMLKAEGKRVWVGGNIGTPLLPVCDQIQPSDFVVVELSSFQLMDMHRSPQRALITNLAPNHLDVHKDMDEYVEAKKNIYRFQNDDGILVVNADNALTAPLQGNGLTCSFSRQGRPGCRVTLLDDKICLDGKPIVNTEDILLPGVHNIENYMAAILTVADLVSEQTVQKVAKTFGGVEHRIELVRVKDGVRYYNDSIASSPSRTIAGLRSFSKKTILIAGGYDKQIPFDELGVEICSRAKAVYLNGTTASAIRQAVENAPNYIPGNPVLVDCADFADAVHKASAVARSGDIVLMSPACAAFDQFKNFIERGKCFKKLVMEL